MAPQSAGGFQALLTKLGSLSAPLPAFDAEGASDTPEKEFLIWLTAAVAGGVSEPHAMTLSTVATDGDPDARVLILKDVTDEGWHFATSALSSKGEQLAVRPAAALTFYWPQLGRQVRVRGSVRRLGGDVAESDFLARSPGAQAIACLGRQSSVLEAGTQLKDLRLPRNLAVPEWWAVYALRPSKVEFWQGSPDRLHTRLEYVRTAQAWIKRCLWP